MDILKLKSTITKIKIDWPNSIFKWQKEESSHSKTDQFHLSHLKTERKKEQSQKNLWNNMKHTNLHVIEPGVKERKLF